MATGVNPDVRYCSQCGQAAPIEEFASFGGTLVCPRCKDLYVQKLREGVAPIQPAFEYGGFWIRLGAMLIDGIILAVAGTAVQLLFLSGTFRQLTQVRPNQTPEQALAMLGTLLGALALSTVVGMAIGASYEGYFVYRLGATPGKMALGLKVVRPDGGPVGLGRAVGRYFGKMLSSMTLGIGYLMVAFDAQKRGMHDMICDTRVIRQNPARTMAAQV